MQELTDEADKHLSERKRRAARASSTPGLAGATSFR